MTERRTIRLTGPLQRQTAIQCVNDAPDGYVCVVAPETRRDAQNAKMWAMLADISRAMPLGRRHTPDDWKAILMSACGWEVQFIEGLDGRPFPQGFRSSKMTVKQMADLITYMTAFGAENGVRWSEKV
jgi:NinB protein